MFAGALTITGANDHGWSNPDGSGIYGSYNLVFANDNSMKDGAKEGGADYATGVSTTGPVRY